MINIYTLKYAVFIVITSTLLSVNAAGTTENIRFESVPITDQLTQQSVRTIFQDKDGFIWLGTQEGLNKYDGHTLETFTSRMTDLKSLSHAFINSVTADKNDDIWVGTKRGVNRLNKRTRDFEQFLTPDKGEGLNDNEAIETFTDKEGDIWVATKKGINEYIYTQNKFKPYNLKTADQQDINIKAVTVADNGVFWLGTENNGLFTFNPTYQTVTHRDLTVNANGMDKTPFIMGMHIDSNGILWMGTRSAGILHLDTNNENAQIQHVSNIKSLLITNIQEDKEGTIWFASADGLIYNDNGRFGTIKRDPNKPYTISSNQTESILIDRSGVFWLGTFKGVDKWNTATKQFTNISASGEAGKGLSGENITFNIELADGRYLVGAKNGIDFINKDTGDSENFKHEPDNQQSLRSNLVMSAMQASDGTIWLGYRDKGVSSYDPKTDTFTHFRANKHNPDTLKASGVTKIIQTSDGSIWVSTFNGGVSKLNDSKTGFTTYMHDPEDNRSISSNRIMTIYESSDNKLWLGTWDAGISIFDPKTGTATNIIAEPELTHTLADNQILTIKEDSRGNMWFGTGGAGVHALSKEDKEKGRFHFTRITQKDGLKSNTIFGVIESGKGKMWVSTNRGLARIDCDEMEIKSFTVSQGLINNEFNSGAYFKTKDGNMMFGGQAGVTVFHPDNIKTNDTTPNTVITAFNRINKQTSIQQAINDNNQIEIQHKEYLVGFEFVGLDFVSTQDIQYRYRLKGFDNDWVEGRATRHATYTNLPSGKYTFEVVSSNGGGLWSDKPASVQILVHPAPWATKYTYTGYAIAFALVIAGIYRHQTQKEKQTASSMQTLETTVSLKTQELNQAKELLHLKNITDELTGLNNRRYLLGRTDYAMAALKEINLSESNSGGETANSETRIFFLILDIDNFKSINEKHGNGAGDIVLKEIAKILHKTCRATDTKVRWGGDEFAITGDITEVGQIERLASRLVQKIKDHNFEVGKYNKLNLTCSIGFSLYPFSAQHPDAVQWEQVQVFADEALYMSKIDGKNRWSGIIQSDQKLEREITQEIHKDIKSAVNNNHVKVIKMEQ